LAGAALGRYLGVDIAGPSRSGRAGDVVDAIVMKLIAERMQLTQSTASASSASCCSRTLLSCRCWS